MEELLQMLDAIRLEIRAHSLQALRLDGLTDEVATAIAKEVTGLRIEANTLADTSRRNASWEAQN